MTAEKSASPAPAPTPPIAADRLTPTTKVPGLAAEEWQSVGWLTTVDLANVMAAMSTEDLTVSEEECLSTMALSAQLKAVKTVAITLNSPLAESVLVPGRFMAAREAYWCKEKEGRTSRVEKIFVRWGLREAIPEKAVVAVFLDKRFLATYFKVPTLAVEDGLVLALLEPDKAPTSSLRFAIRILGCMFNAHLNYKGHGIPTVPMAAEAMPFRH